MPLIRESIEEVNYERHENDKAIELNAATELALSAGVERGKALVGQWLDTWLAQQGNAPFSTESFMGVARDRFLELADTRESDATPLAFAQIEFGLDEYDQLKQYVFDALAEYKLTQTFDDSLKHVQLKATGQ